MSRARQIGFTGTQVGMNTIQKDCVRVLLANLKDKGYVIVHHGDCIGADSDFHEIAKELGYFIVIHPPKNSYKRAFKECNHVFPEKEYLDRNKDIVASCEIMIATPKEKQEQLRSGTWATIRYAMKAPVKLYVVYPEADPNSENHPKVKLNELGR